MVNNAKYHDSSLDRSSFLLCDTKLASSVSL